MAIRDSDNEPVLSRRSLLKRGLMGGALLAVGGGSALALRRTKLVPLPKEGLSVLDPVEYAIMHAIGARVVPAREGFPQLDVAANVDKILARTGDDLQKE